MTLAYSTNTDSNDISVIDMKSKQEITKIPVGGSPRGPVEFDKTKTFGYVCNTASNTVSVIDLFTNRESTKIKVGAGPRGISLSDDSKYAFVSNSGDNTLSIIDLRKREKIMDIALGDNPRHMKAIPMKKAILIPIWGSDYVALVDYSKGIENIAVTKAIGVGKDARPYSVTVDSKGRRAYVANTQANYLSVIDILTAQVIERIKVGFGGRASELSFDEKFLFVSVENSGECVVVVLPQCKVIHKIKVGPSPRGLVLIDKNTLLMSNFSRETSPPTGRNALSVVDVSNPRKARYVGNIKVGLGPCSVSRLIQTLEEYPNISIPSNYDL